MLTTLLFNYTYVCPNSKYNLPTVYTLPIACKPAPNKPMFSPALGVLGQLWMQGGGRAFVRLSTFENW